MDVRRDPTQAELRSLIFKPIFALILIVFGAATAVSFVEHGKGGSIATFGDGLWWALETITTVGYGDEVPVTTFGRIVGGLLMVTGIALFLYLATRIANLIVERQAHNIEKRETELEQDIQDITQDELNMHARLNEVLARLDRIETMMKSRDDEHLRL